MVVVVEKLTRPPRAPLANLNNSPTPSERGAAEENGVDVGKRQGGKRAVGKGGPDARVAEDEWMTKDIIACIESLEEKEEEEEDGIEKSTFGEAEREHEAWVLDMEQLRGQCASLMNELAEVRGVAKESSAEASTLQEENVALQWRISELEHLAETASSGGRRHETSRNGKIATPLGDTAGGKTTPASVKSKTSETGELWNKLRETQLELEGSKTEASTVQRAYSERISSLERAASDAAATCEEHLATSKTRLWITDSKVKVMAERFSSDDKSSDKDGKRQDSTSTSGFESFFSIGGSTSTPLTTVSQKEIDGLQRENTELLAEVERMAGSQQALEERFCELEARAKLVDGIEGELAQARAENYELACKHKAGLVKLQEVLSGEGKMRQELAAQVAIITKLEEQRQDVTKALSDRQASVRSSQDMNKQAILSQTKDDSIVFQLNRVAEENSQLREVALKQERAIGSLMMQGQQLAALLERIEWADRSAIAQPAGLGGSCPRPSHFDDFLHDVQEDGDSDSPEGIDAYTGNFCGALENLKKECKAAETEISEFAALADSFCDATQDIAPPGSVEKQAHGAHVLNVVSLETENERLNAENERLNAENERLIAANDLLSHQLATAKDQYQSLESQVETDSSPTTSDLEVEIAWLLQSLLSIDVGDFGERQRNNNRLPCSWQNQNLSQRFSSIGAANSKVQELRDSLSRSRLERNKLLLNQREDSSGSSSSSELVKALQREQSALTLADERLEAALMAKRELALATKALGSLETDTDSLRAQVKSLLSEKSHESATATAISEQLSSVIKQRDELGRELGEALERERVALVRAEEYLSGARRGEVAEKQFNQLRLDVAKREDLVSSLRQDVQESEKARLQESEALAVSTGRIAALEREIDHLQRQIENNREEMNAKDAVRQKDKEVAATANNRAEYLQREVGAKKAALKDIHTQLREEREKRINAENRNVYLQRYQEESIAMQTEMEAMRKKSSSRASSQSLRSSCTQTLSDYGDASTALAPLSSLLSSNTALVKQISEQLTHSLLEMPQEIKDMAKVAAVYDPASGRAEVTPLPSPLFASNRAAPEREYRKNTRSVSSTFGSEDGSQLSACSTRSQANAMRKLLGKAKRYRERVKELEARLEKTEQSS